LDFDYRAVAVRDDIPPGQGRSYELGDRRIAVFNNGGTFFAIDDTCPHMGASLAEGSLESNVVTCPLHAWRFDVRDGTWCDNPRVKIDSFPVQISGDEILVGIPQKNREAGDASSK